MNLNRNVHGLIKILFRHLLNKLNIFLINPRLLFRRIYLGSDPEVNGIKLIDIGDCFYVRSRLWLDCITDYRGQKFKPNIKIGNKFSASNSLHIAAINRIIIGNDCLFGSNILVTDHSHGGVELNYSAPISKPLHSKGPVLIGDRVWLGDNVVVLSGARIGDDVVVGANSVVIGELPSGSICAGSPCKPIRMRLS